VAPAPNLPPPGSGGADPSAFSSAPSATAADLPVLGISCRQMAKDQYVCAKVQQLLQSSIQITSIPVGRI
jgi:hypothetical protein